MNMCSDKHFVHGLINKHRAYYPMAWSSVTVTSGGDLALSLGGTEKFPFSRPTFLMTFLLVIDQVFLIFCIFTVLDVVYDPFFTRKNTVSEKNSLMTLFYSVRTFARIRHYFSKYWGDRCMGRPPPQIFGGQSPSPF